MTKPRLLDLFCGAGGAGMGYYRAGFDVVGVDIKAQPRYPFEFICGDALAFVFLHGHEYDVIHASPPCQGYSVMTRGRWQDREHPQLIPAVRQLLIALNRPYVIENVSGARSELVNPVLLCGTMFGLQTRHGSQLRRHRYFETSMSFFLTPPCKHLDGLSIGVYGGGQNPTRKQAAVIGVYGHTGGSSTRQGVTMFGADDRRDAMGIDWMTQAELSEAIPPAYAEYIGKHLLEAIAV